MIILKLLSEEVFDFSSGQMTQTKAKHLKDTMCSQFSDVFTLCQYVLENSQNPPLVGATLETLLRFLNWIPLGYIFETTLIQTLICKFLDVPMFRNVTLKCLTEIAGVSVPHYDDRFIALFSTTMERLQVGFLQVILKELVSRNLLHKGITLFSNLSKSGLEKFVVKCFKRSPMEYGGGFVIPITMPRYRDILAFEYKLHTECMQCFDICFQKFLSCIRP